VAPFDGQDEGEAWAAAHAFDLWAGNGPCEHGEKVEEEAMATSEDIERLVAPLVTSAGLELVDVELTPAPRVLRVRVDSPDGVDLEGLGPLAKSISHALDEVDAVPGGHYDLEVSSPGLERPLRRPEHFSRVVGSKVRLRTRPGGDGRRRLEGVLLTADERGIRVLPDEGGEPQEIAFADIERARTVFDWQAALAAGPSRAEARRSGRAARRSPAVRPHHDDPDRAGEPDQPDDSGPHRERAATP
jgi:ribosome maturation factor RimP